MKFLKHDASLLLGLLKSYTSNIISITPLNGIEQTKTPMFLGNIPVYILIKKLLKKNNKNINPETAVDDRDICRKTFPNRNLLLNDSSGE